MITKLILKPEKEWAILRGHPWVYKEALAEFPAQLEIGSEVEILSSKKRSIGIGIFDPESQIAVRLIPGKGNLRRRISERLTTALELRKRLFTDDHRTSAYRLINGEGDGLGGIVADKYENAVSIQLYTRSWEKYLDLIVSKITKLFPEIRWIVRRQRVRKSGLGTEEIIFGKDFPGTVIFKENGLNFQADLFAGQKTGFFLDQRENRALIGRIARNCRVANICGYTGAFTVYALAGGAKEVITVDSAAPALEEAKQNIKINHLSSKQTSFVCCDMFEFLENCTDQFDLIILDPPSMAHSRKDVPKALKAYQKLNFTAFKKVKAGGLLFTASCSGQVSRDDFIETVTRAAAEATRNVRLLCETHHPLDHPIQLGHPEGRYLHGLLLSV